MKIIQSETDYQNEEKPTLEQHGTKKLGFLDPMEVF